MTPVPLHPALVHLPLGLAFILPILTVGFTWALCSGRIRPRAWLTIVGLEVLLLGAGLVALNTGEHEGERIESAVPKTALESHEARAEQFLWATGVTLALAAAVLVVRRAGSPPDPYRRHGPRHSAGGRSGNSRWPCRRTARVRPQRGSGLCPRQQSTHPDGG